MKTKTKALLILGAFFMPIIPYIYLKRAKRGLGLVGIFLAVAFIGGILEAMETTRTDIMALVAYIVLLFLWIAMITDILRMIRQREQDKEQANNNPS